MTVCGTIVLVLACWLVGSFLFLVFSKSHLWEKCPEVVVEAKLERSRSYQIRSTFKDRHFAPYYI